VRTLVGWFCPAALAIVPSLGAQAVSVDLRGIYVDGNALPASTNNSAALQNALAVNGVDGLVLVIGWKDLETGRRQFDWSTVDLWTGRAVAAGKKVEMSVRADLAPSWLFAAPPTGAGADSLHFVYAAQSGAKTCKPLTIAAPWDSTFLNEWDLMLDSLAAHLRATGAYGSVPLLRLTGIDRNSDELHLPSQTPATSNSPCVSDAVSTWLGAGYRPSRLLQGWDAITTSFKTYFPDKTFSVAIIASTNPFPPIAEDGSVITNVSASVLDSTQNLPLITLAAQKFPGRLVVQNNSLYPTDSAQSLTVNFAQSLGTLIAFQTNEAFSNPPAAACGPRGDTTTVCTATTFLQELNTGVYPHGPGNPLRARYIEVFSGNVDSLPATILQAHLELVSNPTPALTSISPAHAAAGGAVTLTVAGTNFERVSVVNFDGLPEPTTFVSATQLSAVVRAADNATGGAIAVTVTSPQPGGGTTTAGSFTADGFTVASSTSAATVTAGESAGIPLTIAPSDANGFSSAVTLAIAGLPTGATATFSQNPTTPGNGAAAVTLTIATTARSGALAASDSDAWRTPRPAIMSGSLLVAISLLTLVRGRRERAAPVMRDIVSLTLLSLACGCGSASDSTNPPSGGTPAGTSQLTVTATAGTLSRQVSLTLTVR
jgi:hypothetical protein